VVFGAVQLNPGYRIGGSAEVCAFAGQEFPLGCLCECFGDLCYVFLNDEIRNVDRVVSPIVRIVRAFQIAHYLVRIFIMLSPIYFDVDASIWY
jgi:hypothetical protein